MVKSASHTGGFVGRAHSKAATTTLTMISTPPIVGVPFFRPCVSKRRFTSSRVRTGWPNFSEISLRMTRLPKMNEIRNAVSAAANPRKVEYSKTRKGPKYRLNMER